MKLVPARGVFLAVATAVLMHLLLFVAVQPSGGHEMTDIRKPPATRYADEDTGSVAGGASVRVINSPVIFSFPSQMGFSRALTEYDVQTRKAFMQQPTRSEHFLEVASYTQHAAGKIMPERLMVSVVPREPVLPDAGALHGVPFSTARRVTMSPSLRNRLMGGVVMPPSLNKVSAKPWAVHASVRISDQGEVSHVLMDQPLEPASLNEEILRMLYSLRFRAGLAIDGSVDIYSAEGTISSGEEP